MNKLAKERKEKLKKEIKDDLRLAKINAEIRRKNEQRVKDDLGVREAISKFHEPITDMMKIQESARLDTIKAIENVRNEIQDISLPPLESSRIIPELKYDDEDLSESFHTMFNGVQRINLNKDLDVSLIKKLDFELPSELINKSEEQLNEIIKRANDKNKEIGYKKGPAVKEWRNANVDSKERLERKINRFDYKINMIKKYVKALKTLKDGNYYIGEGIDKMDLLGKLTDKICEGNKSKKLYNQIVTLLDILLKNEQITNEQVKQYYAQFLS